MSMTDEQILQALKSADAIRTGHFVLTSGRHSGDVRAVRTGPRGPALTTQLAGPQSSDFRRA